MPLSAEEKEQRRFERLYAKSREFMPTTYLRKFTAPSFQRMIRAEAGAVFGDVPVVKDGEVVEVFADFGECACVTCGEVHPWAADKYHGVKGVDTGHFIGSRRQSVVLEPTNVAIQCQRCNKYLNGNPEAFMKWMLAVRGKESIEKLEQLKWQKVKFTTEELVRLRMGYDDRIKAAIEIMKDHGEN